MRKCTGGAPGASQTGGSKGPGYKTAAYDVKNWSISQIVAILQRHNFGFTWGWRQDPKAPLAISPSVACGPPQA